MRKGISPIKGLLSLCVIGSLIGSGFSPIMAHAEEGTVQTQGFKIHQLADKRKVPVVDTEAPTIQLKIRNDEPQQPFVFIDTTITDNQRVSLQKYVVGVQEASYFHTEGKNLYGKSLLVKTNGTYTFYVKDASGNETVSTIIVDNIQGESNLALKMVMDLAKRVEEKPSEYLLRMTKAKVENLPESPEKTDLLSRLDQVDTQLTEEEVSKAIADAEKYPTAEYVHEALENIGRIGDVELKNRLEYRMNVLRQNHIQAFLEESILTLRNADQLIKKEYVDKARLNIKLYIPVSSPFYQPIMDQINAIENLVNVSRNLTKNYTVSLLNNPFIKHQIGEYLGTPDNTPVPDAVLKSSLQEALQAIQNVKTIQSQQELQQARSVIERLPDTSPYKSILLAQIDQIQNFLNKSKETTDGYVDGLLTDPTIQQAIQENQ